MAIELRVPTDDDWSVLLDLAHAALPWDSSGNREWLTKRQQFAGRRRHYLAIESDTGAAIGYGDVEEGPEDGMFRVYIVAAPENINRAGDPLYDQLLRDLHDMAARGLWVREYARDEPTLSFFSSKGFVEQERFTLPGLPEMVVMNRPLP